MMRKVLCWLLVCMLALGTCFAETKSQNPIFGEKVSKKYTKTQDKMVNILLLGIDYGYLRTDHISSKGNLNDCHTDAMVLVSINKTQKTVDLVSLPRDTLSYVPGARGIYKVNAAVNCAPDLESGIQKTLQTISRHLGGIEIHQPLVNRR